MPRPTAVRTAIVCAAPQTNRTLQQSQVIVIDDSSDEDEQEQQALLETAPTVQVSRWLHCWERCLLSRCTGCRNPHSPRTAGSRAGRTGCAAGGDRDRAGCCWLRGERWPSMRTGAGGRRAGRALPSCAHNIWWCTPVQEDQELEALAAAAAAALAAPVLAIAPTAEVSRRAHRALLLAVHPRRARITSGGARLHRRTSWMCWRPRRCPCPGWRSC
jgi:hypothetical protein